jgi:transcriptional regulator with XRE-family HTH domain
MGRSPDIHFLRFYDQAKNVQVMYTPHNTLQPYQTSRPNPFTITGMGRRAYIATEIGDRIRRLRKERGWTQKELAERIGCSQRAIVYYERDGKYPPAPVLAAMAGAFGISLDTIMAPDEPARKAGRDEPDLLNNPEDRRLWRKLQLIKTLPERDRAAVVRLINSLAGTSPEEG